MKTREREQQESTTMSSSETVMSAFSNVHQIITGMLNLSTKQTGENIT